MKKTKEKEIDNGELFIKKYLEVKSYRHKGIDIAVKINFSENTLTLCDVVNSMYSDYEYKSFVFRNRTPEYFQGWKNILDAMKYAIDKASEDLKSYRDLEEARNTFLQELQVKEIIKNDIK